MYVILKQLILLNTGIHLSTALIELRLCACLCGWNQHKENKVEKQ